jgi:uncharacterized XkdX family phage protein
MKSKNFEKVKDYYNDGNGLWSISRVRDAVKMKWITEEEFELITGEKYA